MGRMTMQTFCGSQNQEKLMLVCLGTAWHVALSVAVSICITSTSLEELLLQYERNIVW
jgi:hypothetical protein